MNRNLKSALAAIPLALTVFSNQALADSTTLAANVDAEKISQYIYEADVHREFRVISDERARIKQGVSSNNKPGELTQNVPAKTITSIRDLRRVNMERSFGWLSAKTRGNLLISVPDTSERAVYLQRSNNLNTNKFIVGLPNEHVSIKANIAGDGSIIYSSKEQLTDVAVQTFEDSTRILTILKDQNSPSRYSYRINVPLGGKIEKSDNGGIIIIDGKKSFVGGFAPPWAVDRDGKEIPTRYEISGNTVVQIVDHTTNNPRYPVVADPYLFIDLISSASWRSSDPGYTLAVVPTTWARSLAGGYLPGSYGWDELYAKYSNVGRGIRTNFNGMRDQYICHQQFAALKSSWNLDEYRPDVGYVATVNALCNPGGINIFD